jgi:hypothetical protein
MSSPAAPDLHQEHASGLGRLGREVGGGIDNARHTAGRDRLLQAIVRPSRRLLSPRRLLLAAAAIAVLAIGMLWRARPVQLAFDVSGPVERDGDWIGVAPTRGPVAMHFTDGTEVDLAPGSKGRVAEVTPVGARVVLGAGELQARVVHRPHARWSIEAGPYSVEVTGTAFDVGWRDEGQELEVRLHEGSVVVRGPSFAEGLHVAAGQRLVAHAGTGEAQLMSLLAPRVEPSPPVGAPRPSRVPVDRSAPRRASPPPPSWAELLADGNFHDVVDAAEARGVDATLGDAPRADVVALADAARYLHDRPLAKRGLLAERSRFAGSPEARAAAFVLGTMADDGGAHEEAIRWYDTYLAESPSGSFAAEALGRKVVALATSGQSAAAAAAARQYLRRFPQGAHAGYARDLLSAAP